MTRVFFRLPESEKAILATIARRRRRSMTAEVRSWLQREAEAEGLVLEEENHQPPQTRKAA